MWHDFIDATNKSFVRLENWLQGLPTVKREEVVGMIQARENEAARGRLPRGSAYKIEPVREYEHMFEDKWHTYEPATGKRREIRQYHAEPPSDKKALVRLHRHLKQVDIPSMIRSWQQNEIKFAKNRFDIWLNVGSTTQQ